MNTTFPGFDCDIESICASYRAQIDDMYIPGRELRHELLQAPGLNDIQWFLFADLFVGPPT